MNSARLVGACFALSAVLAFAAALRLVLRASSAPPGRSLHVCVLDVSASETRVRSSWSSWARAQLRSEAEAAHAAQAEFAVVRVADEVERSSLRFEPADWLAALDGRGGPAWAPLSPRLGARESRLAQALEVALGLVRTRTQARVVLLSSGAFTGEDPGVPWARLAAEGVALVHRTPPTPEWPDVALVSIALPESLEPGAPAAARVTLRYRPGRRVPERLGLALELRQGGITLPIVHELALPNKLREWTEVVELGELGFGQVDLAATVRLAVGGRSGDPIPENDRASARRWIEGERRVGLVRLPADAKHAADWLLPGGRSTFQGLEFVELSTDELALELASLDAVVTFDIAPDALPRELFEAWLERGGGWLATSGTRAFRPETSEPRIARLLPLEREAPEHSERDVILLVDGSGSMAGAAFEMVRRAAVDLAVAALPNDAVDLRFFTTRLEPPVRVKKRGATGSVGAEASRRLLAARVPERSTYIAASLAALALERAQSERHALVLLLTDGKERENLADPEAAAERVVRSFADVDARLIAIAVGDDPDTEYLRRFLAPGEDVRFAKDLEDLRRLFEVAIADERLQLPDPPLAVLPVAARDDSLAANAVVAAELLGTLARYWKTFARPGAEVAWTSADGDPALGLTRFGLGRIAQFASHPRAGWGAGWVDRRGLGEPAAFGPLLRWLARRPRARGAPRLARRDGELELEFQAGLEGVPPLIEIDVAGTDGELVGRVRFARPVDPAGVGRGHVRRAGLLPRAYWAEAEALVLRFPEPIGPLPIERPPAREFEGEPTFRGPSHSGLDRSSRARSAPRSRAGGLGLALAAAALGLVGLGIAAGKNRA